jgi:hypothetical protein
MTGGHAYFYVLNQSGGLCRLQICHVWQVLFSH